MDLEETEVRNDYADESQQQFNRSTVLVRKVNDLPNILLHTVYKTHCSSIQIILVLFRKTKTVYLLCILRLTNFVLLSIDPYVMVYTLNKTVIPSKFV
jgi:hypothetical protein